MQEVVRTTRVENVAIVTMARPEKRNALDPGLVAALKTALAEAAGDARCRAVVLAGEGRAFSAGADLEYLLEIAGNSPRENAADSAALRDLFAMIHDMPVPTIARVHGPALAGGCGLALACDIVVAGESASFGFPEVRIGFVPAMVARLLAERVGAGVARELLLTGRTLTAAEAAAARLVTRVVPDDALDAAVDGLVACFARETSPQAVRLTKRLLLETADMDFSAAIRHASVFNALARTTTDFRKGIESFVGKTKPEWGKTN